MPVRSQNTEITRPQTYMKYSGEHNKRQCIHVIGRHSQPTVVRVCVFFPFILDVKFVGSTSRDHTGFLIHLPSAVRAFIFLTRRIQPFLSLVDREVELRKNPSYRDSNSRPNVITRLPTELPGKNRNEKEKKDDRKKEKEKRKGKKKRKKEKTLE